MRVQNLARRLLKAGGAIDAALEDELLGIAPATDGDKTTKAAAVLGGGYGAPGMMGGVAASIPLDVAMPPAGSAYAAFLQRAGLADLSDLEAMQLFYRAGVDPRGRPVFVFWAGSC